MATKDQIRQAIDAGFSDEEITAMLAKPPKGHMGRGDELGQPDPNPSGAIIRLGVGPLTPAGFDLDTNNPEDMTHLGAIQADEAVRQFGAGSAVGGIAGNAIRGVLTPAKTMLGRIGQTAISSAGGWAAGRAAAAVTGGAGPVEALKQGSEGAAEGAAVGLVAGSLGEALSGAARYIRNSRGGQARALIEKYGGKVGPFDSGSGVPELDGLKTVTDADVGAQSRASAKDLIAANDRMFDAEGRQPYKAALRQLETPPDVTEMRPVDMQVARGLPPPSGRAMPLNPRQPATVAAEMEVPAKGIPAAQRPVDVTAFRQKMMEVSLDPATDPATKAFLERQMAEMESLPRNQRGVYIADEKWINGKTSMFMKLAKPDKLAAGAGSPRDAVFGEVAGVGQALREQGPYAPANAAYAEAKGRSGDFREALGMARTPNANQEVDTARAANFLARRDQTTTTAGIRGTGERLAQLARANPGLARTIDQPSMVVAKGDLQYGLGRNLGGLIGRQPGHWWADALMHNKDAIAGRVFAGAPAGAADAMGQFVSGAPIQAINQGLMLQQAMAHKQQRDRETIQGIFGAGRGKPGPDEKQPNQ